MTLFEKIKDLTGDTKSLEHYAREECVYDYWPLDGHYDDKEAGKICISGCELSKCIKCWNQEYIEDYVTDTNVGNISDNVNHPEHYQGKHECIDVMRVMFGDEAVKGFCKCNAFKYRFRAGRKEENTADQDIKKAEWYEDYLFKMEQEEK
jgi:hypothetical protein